MDLRDYFDSIRIEHVQWKVDSDVIRKCFVNGAPRQGLPTSPLISNIALVDCDNQIVSSMAQLSCSFAYTRYADDISISVDEKNAIVKAKYIVSKILKEYGFEINDRKTRVQHQMNGRRIITGIGVDEDGLHPTRKTRKKIRAAEHQGNRSSIDGLIAWSLCKLPGQAYGKKSKVPWIVSDGKYQICKYCGEGGLKWYFEDGARSILVSSFSKQKHVCEKLPAPIHKNAVVRSLELAGFEEFQPLSKTWTTGYFSSLHSRSLFVLFRKNGVDMGFHSYQHALERAKDRHVSMAGGLITERHNYCNREANVHSIVINMVDTFVRGYDEYHPSFLDVDN